MNPEIKVKLVEGASVPLPRYQTAGAAGFDLYAAIVEKVTLAPGERRLIPSGIAMAHPEGFEGQVRPRSGLALKYGVTVLNSPGTIDRDFSGEVGVLLVNLGTEDVHIEPRSRIAQMVIAPVISATLVEVNSLPGTARGSEGFGSTGSG